MLLRNWIEERKSEWAKGVYLSADPRETFAANLRAVAECDMAQVILDVSLEQLNGVSNGE